METTTQNAQDHYRKWLLQEAEKLNSENQDVIAFREKCKRFDERGEFLLRESINLGAGTWEILRVRELVDRKDDVIEPSGGTAVRRTILLPACATEEQARAYQELLDNTAWIDNLREANKWTVLSEGTHQ